MSKLSDTERTKLAFKLTKAAYACGKVARPDDPMAYAVSYLAAMLVEVATKQHGMISIVEIKADSDLIKYGAMTETAHGGEEYDKRNGIRNRDVDRGD